MRIFGKLAAASMLFVASLSATAFAGDARVAGETIMTPVVWLASAPEAAREAVKIPHGVVVANACTAACQKKHNACYNDCDVRYADSLHTADCKGDCDADKRACRAACY